MECWAALRFVRTGVGHTRACGSVRSGLCMGDGFPSDVYIVRGESNTAPKRVCIGELLSVSLVSWLTHIMFVYRFVDARW